MSTVLIDILVSAPVEDFVFVYLRRTLLLCWGFSWEWAKLDAEVA
jgi:hypothetical protein